MDRKVPPGALQADILIAQHNACVYCGHDFGDPVYDRAGNIHCWRELEWEHFVPYSYLMANPDDNWVAACDVCNGFKSDLIFDSIDSVRHHVLERYVSKRYTPLPITVDYDDGDWNGWSARVNHEMSISLSSYSAIKSKAADTIKVRYCKYCRKPLSNKRKTADIYLYCNTGCACRHLIKTGNTH